MGGMMGRIGQFARSPKGRELAQRAARYARDPETRRKIADARRRLARREQGGG